MGAYLIAFLVAYLVAYLVAHMVTYLIAYLVAYLVLGEPGVGAWGNQGGFGRGNRPGRRALTAY